MSDKTSIVQSPEVVYAVVRQLIHYTMNTAAVYEGANI